MEYTWLLLALLAGYAAVKGYIMGDHRNAFTMAILTGVSLLMFFLRRKLRKSKNDD